MESICYNRFVSRYNFNTEVGMLAIWDSKSLSFVNNKATYEANFVKDSTMVQLMEEGKIVVWGTGGDGSFLVDVRIDQEKDLTAEEEKIVVSSLKNYKLIVTSGKVLVGTPEYAGSVENEGLSAGAVAEVENLKEGKYLVNVYFLYSNEWVDDDKTGYVVSLHKASDDQIFSVSTSFPQLG